MRAEIVRQSITVSVAAGFILLGQACAAQAEKDMLAESQRIVSQHKAVLGKMPLGLSPHSTDAILLGNGDIAMSISMTPLEKHQPTHKCRERRGGSAGPQGRLRNLSAA